MIQYKLFNTTLFILAMITAVLNNLINFQVSENLVSRQSKLNGSLGNLQSDVNRLIDQKTNIRAFLVAEKDKIFYSWNHLKLIMRH